ETQPAAAAAGAELRLEPFEETRPVACERGILASVASNLIRNAIKFMGEKEERRVVVRVEGDDKAVRVEVADTGPGLLPGTEELIFQPYSRVGNRPGNGLGLGLATVKRLVEAHGGRVGVHSVPSVGATFWFELPTQPARAYGPSV